MLFFFQGCKFLISWELNMVGLARTPQKSSVFLYLARYAIAIFLKVGKNQYIIFLRPSGVYVVYSPTTCFFRTIFLDYLHS